jgi:hypothetical protein
MNVRIATDWGEAQFWPADLDALDRVDGILLDSPLAGDPHR